MVFLNTVSLIIRYTTAYGEPYDYNSIMHYTSTAFAKRGNMLTIVPKEGGVTPDSLGRKVNLSTTDVVKLKKMYKCEPYENW